MKCIRLALVWSMYKPTAGELPSELVCYGVRADEGRSLGLSLNKMNAIEISATIYTVVERLLQEQSPCEIMVLPEVQRYAVLPSLIYDVSQLKGIE